MWAILEQMRDHATSTTIPAMSKNADAHAAKVC